jgi:hypothetical protein
VHSVGWFDLYRLDRLLQGEVDHEGVKAAVSYLDGLVEAETKEVPASRIVVGGFSQVSSETSHMLRTHTPHKNIAAEKNGTGPQN